VFVGEIELSFLGERRMRQESRKLRLEEVNERGVSGQDLLHGDIPGSEVGGPGLVVEGAVQKELELTDGVLEEVSLLEEVRLLVELHASEVEWLQRGG